jgi:cellulose synthase operon protein C
VLPPGVSLLRRVRRLAIGSSVVALALAGCATLTTKELPLSPRRQQRLEQELQRRSAQDPAALRDLGWLRLLGGGRSAASLALFEQALERDGGDRLALLGRAQILNDQGRYRQSKPAWLELLRACGGDRGPLCASLRSLALRKLEALAAEGDLVPLATLEQMLRSPIDPLARDLVLVMISQHLRRQGKAAELERRTRERGCLRRWTVAGPAHHLPHADLSRAVSLQGGRPAATAGCRVMLRGERHGGGIFLMTTEIDAPRELPVVLSVESDAPWQLLVDGALVYTHDSAERRLPGRARLALTWPEGSHRLALRVGAASGSAAVRVLIAVDAAPPPRFTPAAENAAPRAVRSLGCGATAAELLGGRPAWYAPLAHQLVAEQALLCRDFDLLHEQLAIVGRWAPAFVGRLLLSGMAMTRDPLFPERLATERSLRAAQEALRRDPDLGRAAFNVATYTLRLEKNEEALQLFRDGARRWPDDYRWRTALQRIYRERSWAAEEEAALEQALRLQPDHCALIEDLIGVKRARRDMAAMARWIDHAERCDASSEARARQLRDRGRLREALDRYRALLRLRPGDQQLRRELASLLLLLGRRDEARQEIERLLAELPGSTDERTRLADLKLLAGDGRGAEDELRGAKDVRIWRRELRRALERLTARSVMARYRVDGRAAIARFRQRKQTYDTPAVLVQDRMVVRLLPNGASVNLTHNIIQVLSKEGIERWGEVRLPRGAEVLTLRGIKADGTTREPEEIIGKGSISVPDLEEGDFVEIEYLDATAPAPAHDGVQPKRFYFRSFEVPMVTSEMLVIAPRRFPLRVESVGEVPAVKRTMHGDEVQLHWVARDGARILPEPRTVAPDEYIPSVRVSSGGDWERSREQLADRALEGLRGSWPLRAWAAAAIGAARTPRQRAEALYRKVLDGIEPSGGVIGDATQAILRGRGSRYSALISTLRQVGIPAELWMVRPLHAAQGETDPPDLTRFTAPLVRCALPEGPVFLEPRDAAVPFGYVSPELRGATALRVAVSGPARVQVPERLAVSDDWRQVGVQLRFHPDGTARLEVEEKLQGVGAQQWRTMLRRVDRERLKKLFEGSALGMVFPGAALERLSFDGEKAPALPLVLRYAFTTSSLVRQQQGKLLLKIGLYQPYLSQLYVGLARRQRALQVGFHAPATMTMKITPPPGLAVGTLPAAVDVQTSFGSFSRTVRRDVDGTVSVTARFRLRFRRISTAEYADFARFARTVDDHFKAELQFQSISSAPAS